MSTGVNILYFYVAMIAWVLTIIYLIWIGKAWYEKGYSDGYELRYLVGTNCVDRKKQ